MTGLRTAKPADWPEYLTATELKDIFDCSLRSAQRKLKAGRFGKYFELDVTRYVRREVLVRHLQRLEIAPEPRRTAQVHGRR